MSLAIYSEKHYVGPLASIGGYRDLVQYFDDDKGPIGQFLADGYTNEPQQLRGAIQAFLAIQVEDDVSADILHTLSDLEKTLAPLHLIAIIHDTVFDDHEASAAAGDKRDAAADAGAAAAGDESSSEAGAGKFDRFIWQPGDLAEVKDSHPARSQSLGNENVPRRQKQRGSTLNKRKGSTSTAGKPITVFSFGYWGWGTHTRELIKLVDATEKAAGYEPPLWVDVRYHRNVRATGFNGDAFEAMLGGSSRYLWLQGLGNRAVSYGGDMEIHSPADISKLLEAARAMAAEKRRVIFYCGCKSAEAKGCHRWLVGDLLLRAATKGRVPIVVVEWPGLNTGQIELRIISTKCMAQLRSAIADWHLTEILMTGPLASLPKAMAHGTILHLQAAPNFGKEDTLALITGPANPARGWRLPVYGWFDAAYDESCRAGTDELLSGYTLGYMLPRTNVPRRRRR